MFLEESGVVFSILEQKKQDGGKFILMNFYESLRKIPSRVPFFINLKKFRGCVGYWLEVRARGRLVLGN